MKEKEERAARTASMIDQRWKRPSSSSDHGETCGSEIRRYPPSGSTSAWKCSSLFATFVNASCTTSAVAGHADVVSRS